MNNQFEVVNELCLKFIHFHLKYNYCKLNINEKLKTIN